MASVTLATGQIVEFDRVGTGPPILLISGLGSNRSSWIEVVNALRQRFTVITCDLRGDRDGPITPFSIADLATDAKSLLEALEVGPAIVMGHSQGGFIALELAVAYPETVEALVIAASAAYTDDYGRFLLGHWREVAECIGIAALKRELLLWGFSPHFFNSRGRELRLMELMSVDRPMSLDNYLAHNRACCKYDVRDRLSVLSVPALLLGGSSDIVMTLRHNQLLNSLIPDNQLVTLDGVGHHIFAEAPLPAMEHVHTFLQARVNSWPWKKP